MQQDERFDQRVALVTGASSGIGLATARALAAERCRVILAARRLDRLTEIAQEIGSLALPMRVDLQDRASVDGMLNELPAQFRDIDILINNAGHDPGGITPFHAGSRDAWADIIETNLQALVRMTHVILRGMLDRGRGDIVNIGSTAGFRPNAQRAVYGASKAAVHFFSEGLRQELVGLGVRVIEIAPGLTRSEFALTRLKGDKNKADQFYAQSGVPLETDDVARSIVFALSQPRHVTIAELLLVPSSCR